MTKNVSLADDAYESLALIKRPDESFSDLARRLARVAAQEWLFDPERPAVGDAKAAQAWIARVHAERRKDLGRRIALE